MIRLSAPTSKTNNQTLMAPSESSRSAGERPVWLLKPWDYIPQASRRTIIPVSPGNPLWANIILPADGGDMVADDPLRAGGTRDCLHPGTDSRRTYTHPLSFTWNPGCSFEMKVVEMKTLGWISRNMCKAVSSHCTHTSLLLLFSRNTTRHVWCLILVIS